MVSLRAICAERVWVVAMVLVLGMSASGAGQGTGTVSGTVEGESGGVLPGVTVTATHTSTGCAQTAVSNGRGRYAITNLMAGSYEVHAVLPGFASDVAVVTVAAGGSARVEMSLTIAPLAETVIVTRTDQHLAAVPRSVTVVQRDHIDYAQRKTSPDEALRGIPGLFVQNRRNFGLSGGIGLSIRAPQPRFELRGLAIIQDGIPITTADGTTEPGNIDLGSVGRIDVIRGPSSVLYGNSAAGVLSLTTTFDPTRRLTVRPDIQFGSYGYHRQQLRVDGVSARTQVMASVSRFETDGFRENSHAEITQVNVVVRRDVSSDTEIRAVFNLYDTPFAQSAGFLNEDDALNNPRMARVDAVARNWGTKGRVD